MYFHIRPSDGIGQQGDALLLAAELRFSCKQVAIKIDAVLRISYYCHFTTGFHAVPNNINPSNVGTIIFRVQLIRADIISTNNTYQHSESSP